MALSANDAFASGRRRSRRGRARRGALSEINVTPLVDVMLVLLIIFMISAPLLTVGVPVDLPKTQASALQDQNEPITLTIRKDGAICWGEQSIALAALVKRVELMAGGHHDRPIYVRADGQVAYARVAEVMAALSTSGFGRINLITDAGDPVTSPTPHSAAAP